MTSGGRLPGRSAAMVLRMSGFSTSSSLGEALAPFLIFSVASRGHAPVGHGGGEDGDVGRQRLAHGLQHLARGLDADDLHAGRIGQVGRAADEDHVGAERRGLGGDRRALLAGGAVGDVAHGVDGLVRGAAGDEHVPAGEGQLPPGFPPPVPPPQVGRGRRRHDGGRTPAALDRLQQLGHLGEAAGAGLAALGHLADVGPDELDAVGLAAARRCGGWPDGATCAGSWRAPPAPACRSPSARRWRGRRRGRRPSWPGGRRWRGPPRSGRPRARGGCGRSRARRRGRRGR